MACLMDVRDLFPRLAFLLRSPEPDVLADLRAPFDVAFSRGRYDWRVDYTGGMPAPVLSPEDAKWAADTVLKHGDQPRSKF